MSKSAYGRAPCRGTARSAGEIRKTIMRATTDSNPGVGIETAGPGVLNLLSIYQGVSGTPTTISSRSLPACHGISKQVAEMVVAIWAFPAAVSPDYFDPGYLAGVLREGADGRADRQRYRAAGEGAHGLYVS